MKKMFIKSKLNNSSIYISPRYYFTINSLSLNVVNLKLKKELVSTVIIITFLIKKKTSFTVYSVTNHE